jgi:hypothetical protein
VGSDCVPTQSGGVDDTTPWTGPERVLTITPVRLYQPDSFDAVVQLAGTRTYTGSTRDGYFAALVPGP